MEGISLHPLRRLLSRPPQAGATGHWRASTLSDVGMDLIRSLEGMKSRSLSQEQEDQLLADDETRKSLGFRQLCLKYKCSETTLRDALKRARKRRKTLSEIDGIRA